MKGLNIKTLSLSTLFLGVVSSCQLDYENTSAINPDGAWGSETMIQAYLTDIYGGLMPGWNFYGDGSDESASLGDYQKGINLSVSSNGIEFNYEYIDKINFFIEQLSNVPENVISKEKNNQLLGQALFWRAWNYWKYVSQLGGVPLILNTQNIDDEESLFVKRSSTSDCIKQIISDLDNAINMLPENWTGTDYGRIDRCAAMAFKGRVLLWYASPLFNRDNDKSRWQNAYDANKAALETCLQAGRNLMPDFGQIWLTSGKSNTEALMFRRYSYPDSYYNMNTLLPEHYTNGYSCCCVPNLPAILSFPLKDGSSMAIYPKDETYNTTPLDTLRLRTDQGYNAEILNKIVNDMDPRFYASYSVPGLSFPTNALPAGQNSWSTYVKDNTVYKSMLDYQCQKNTVTTLSGGFYPLKAVTPDTDKSSSTYGGVNTWIEIRLAEVYMNLAECANELDADGHDYNEALSYIKILRDRAGIEKGTGKLGYGLDKYASLDGVRHLLINERLAEFSQEDMRFDDLRRWMRFDIMNDEKYRSNLFIVYNGEVKEYSDFDWSQSIADPTVRENFHIEFVLNVDQVESSVYNFTTNHWFFPIGLNSMAKNFINDQSQQNKEWGGSFDPLL